MGDGQPTAQPIMSDGQPTSLRYRMLLSATLVLLVFLSLTGAVLDQAFRRSAEQGVSERLLLHIYGLLAVTEQQETGLELPDALAEPRFNQMGTGLYGVVLEPGGRELWRSESALGLTLASDEKVQLFSGLTQGVERFGRVETDRGDSVFFQAYQVSWEVSGEAQAYVFTVLETTDTYASEIAGFRNSLWGWLMGVVIVLVIVQGLVMNWGLAPLAQVARDLQDIEEGRRDSLQGQYPAEIEGVTRNLNLLLASERAQRERYRTTLADLAHSLKTPLAILRTEASSLADRGSDGAGAIDEQIERMDQIVGYQLERAVTKAEGPVRAAFDVAAVAGDLVAALEKVYPDHALELLCDDSVSAYGDERDFMEVLGNLLDNACKYGAGRARLAVAAEGRTILFTVANDGAPIPSSERKHIFERGARLDTAESGQGIGLAVVNEIVDRYGGTLEVGESDLGGAAVSVAMPVG